MRPIRLKIKGLNSFQEEQTVDFEELTRQGFFGIFGPTGSGKSTILDGMILSLYGMKAMSRGTNEFVNKNCKSARVSYEFQISGAEKKRYRVEREFKANEKGTKSGKCRLLDVTDGETVLEETVSGVDRACAEIIGLTADDFMRTVVLPQGKFSEFLKVSGKDRREILERLFRLEEYGAGLEERIAGALKKEQEEQTRLAGQAEVYGAYSEELLKEKETLRRQQEEALVHDGKIFSEKKEQMAETELVWELQTEEKRKAKELRILQEKEEAVKELERRVMLAERAGHVVPVLHAVKELEEKERNLERRLREAEEAAVRRKEELDRLKSEFEQAEKKREEEEGVLIAGISRAEEAARYWEELPGLLRLEKQRESEKAESIQNGKLLAEKEERLCEEKAGLERQAEESERALRERIITSEYRETIEELTGCHNELRRMADELKGKTAEWEQKKDQIRLDEKAVSDLKMAETKLEKQIAQLLEEQERLSESAEQIQTAQLRRKLKAGEPCPVCGSVHFELYRDFREETSDNGLHLLEQAESVKEKVRGKQEELQKKSGERQVKERLLEIEKTEAGQQEEKKKELEELFRAKKEGFVRKLGEYEIKSLTEEKARIRQMDVERETLEQNIQAEKAGMAACETNLQLLRERRAEQKEAETRLEIELAPLKAKIAQKQEQIAEKIGTGRKPEQYLKMLQGKLQELKDIYQEKKTGKEQAELRVKAEEEKLSGLNGEVKGNGEALERGNMQLQSEMERQQFAGRADVERAVLDDKVCQSYREQIENYAGQLQEARLHLKEVQKKLNHRSVTEEQYESGREELRRLEDGISRKKELLVEQRQEIRRIREGLERQTELARQMKVLEHKIAVLEDLRSVTRGKRFVEFMAMERLRYISKSASKRLYEITNGSYELEINGGGEFIIRDNKNGGVLRQTATLSGGETFVTSLALALALSAEIQLKGTAPLELFFLDEGFGSLDETLLDIVMESLEKIHSERLKVGIISHVEAVKTRVPVRLLVSPAQTGVSGSRVKIEYS